MNGLEQIIDTFFNWEIFIDVLPDLVLLGFPNTIRLAFFSYVLALVLGIILAVLAISKRWYLSWPAKLYVDIWRGLPGIIKILIIGLGLPLSGVTIFGRDAYAYAIIAIAMINGAYICEILRSGIQSVDSGQMDASRSLGLPYLKAMQLIIIPQGIRRVLPALMNQFIVTLKETSLVYLLGLAPSQREMFSIAQQATHATVNLTPLVAAGACYLAVVIPLTRVVNWWDKRLREGKANVVADDLDVVVGSGVRG